MPVQSSRIAALSLACVTLAAAVAAGPTPGAGTMLSRASDTERLVLAEGEAAARPVDPNAWIIGFPDPDESVTITSETWNIEQEILLVNQGRLEIVGVDFEIDAWIHIYDDARLVVRNSTFTCRQEFSYQHGLQMGERAGLKWDNVQFISDGSWGVSMTGASVTTFTLVDVPTGFITWALSETASASFDRCTTAGEFVPIGEGTLSFREVDWALLWIHTPAGATLDTALPPGATVDAWSIGPGSAFAVGIPYTVAFEQCRNVNWALMAGSNSTATLRDSELRVVGSLFRTSETVQIRGLSNQAQLTDQSYTWGDISLRFVDTRVQTWNFYAYGGTRLTLEQCVFGEVLAAENGRVDVQRSLCDGTGGYIGVDGQAQIFLAASTNLSQTTARGQGLMVTAQSYLSAPAIDADDNAVLLLLNTSYRGEPAAFRAAAIFDLDIDHVEGRTNDYVPVRGTARLVSGPESLVQMDYYQLQFGPGENPTQWTSLQVPQAGMVRRGELAVWQTFDLDPGSYTLRMRVGNNLTDELEPTSSATLSAGEPRRGASKDWRGYR